MLHCLCVCAVLTLLGPQLSAKHCMVPQMRGVPADIYSGGNRVHIICVSQNPDSNLSYLVSSFGLLIL